MNNIYILYFESGEIESIFFGPEELAKEQGMVYIPGSEGVSEKTHYVDTSSKKHTAKEKQAINTRHKIEGLTVVFSELPPGTVVSVNDNRTVSDKDGLVIEFDVPDTYYIELTPSPQYLREALEVFLG